MLARSAEALFAGLIDYAGLFPPAALSMEQALRNYDAYRQGEHAWMLGRFVVTAQRLEEVLPLIRPSGTFSPPRGEKDLGADDRVRGVEFLSVLGIHADADTIEVKAMSADEVEAIASRTGGKTVYIETADLSLLDIIAQHGLRAKIRTGGVTADAFPAAEAIAHFIRACAERGVAFKATAGLHHPIRCVRPLTYEADAPRGTMHGFVNVFMAAALPVRAEEILMEDDPRAFAFDDDAASWRGNRVATETLRDVRQRFAISFGSCSFEEPVADLKELGWL
ncbi:MAG TPA: hypothetical protein VJ276_02365 [Thermoanaerobaculia bacterium]|nr:hypothetical protein [Thermoanaerobaculia bacterium]